MSAVNVTLEWMTRQRTLTGVAAAYAYAALLVAGPWIFTVIGLLGLGSSGCDASGCGELQTFRSVVIYNSMFALVVSSPIAFLCGRCVADQLHQGRADSITFVLLASLGAFSVIVLATALPFHALATTLPAPARVAAVQNAFLIGASWLIIPFLTAARSGNVTLLAFAANAVLLTALAALLPARDAAAILTRLNAGFALTEALLVAAVVRRFGSGIRPDWAMLAAALRRWELPAAGLAYALGIWADKLIMWAGAAEGRLVAAGVLHTMPSYDTAMFWAQLASIPVMAVAFVHVETRFSGLRGRLYGRLDRQASLRELSAALAGLRVSVVSSIVTLFVTLAVIAVMGILASFVFMEELGLRPAYMAILRVSLFAMAFHTSAIFCFMVLLYFDLRRPALLIVAAYMLLNAVLTAAFLPLGQPFHGYGTMAAAAITFVLAFVLLLRELPWLIYHAFITNNASV